MYNKCPVCEGNRFISRNGKPFICPYCRGTSFDLCPDWTLERKMQMLNFIENKPLEKRQENIIHIPSQALKVTKQRGRPRSAK